MGILIARELDVARCAGSGDPPVQAQGDAGWSWGHAAVTRLVDGERHGQQRVVVHGRIAHVGADAGLAIGVLVVRDELLRSVAPDDLWRGESGVVQVDRGIPGGIEVGIRHVLGRAVAGHHRDLLLTALTPVLDRIQQSAELLRTSGVEDDIPLGGDTTADVLGDLLQRALALDLSSFVVGQRLVGLLGRIRVALQDLMAGLVEVLPEIIGQVVAVAVRVVLHDHCVASAHRYVAG